MSSLNQNGQWVGIGQSSEWLSRLFLGKHSNARRNKKKLTKHCLPNCKLIYVRHSSKRTLINKAGKTKTCNNKKYHVQKFHLNISCWNIRTSWDRENCNSRVQQMFSRYHCTLWSSLLCEGSWNEGGYTFYWRKSGVGFAIKSELIQRRDEISKGVSDRIMVWHLPLSNGRYASLVSV